MFTIHNGINGGWYGSVSADNTEDALAQAERLAEILDALRAAKPRRERVSQDKGAVTLNTKGAALIAWLDANPGANGKLMWEQAKPTKRTFDWLLANGFVAHNTDKTGFVVLKRS